MTLRFIDGFDHLAFGDQAQKWTTVVGTPVSGSIQTGRIGGQCLRTSTNTLNVNGIAKTIDAQASWVVGCAYKIIQTITVSVNVLRFLDAGTLQCELRINSDGTLSVTRNGSSVTGGTSTNALSINTWYFIEMKVTIADSISANSCKVKVNGNDWITVTTGQDLKNTANATANAVGFGHGVTTGSGWFFDFDDIYICDGNGSTNNNFLGDCRIETLYPSGAGTTTAWTASTGANYTCVDETTSNGDTDYVETSTATTKDTYAMGDLTSTPTAIYGIQTVLAARKTDAGSRSVAAVIRSGGTDYDGSTVALADSYACLTEVRETDPATSAAWTASGVNAIEAGIKLIG